MGQNIKNPPAFQFYPGDFLADENVMLMGLAARGAYITLICFCWREGSIPADPGRMARLCGVDGSAMNEVWPEIKPCFKASETDPSRLIHPRLEKERAKQLAFSSERQASGRRGAEKRWGKPEGPGGGGSSTPPPPSIAVVKEDKRKAAAAGPSLPGNGSAIAKPLGDAIAKNGFSSSSSSSSSSSEGGGSTHPPGYLVGPSDSFEDSPINPRDEIKPKWDPIETALILAAGWRPENLDHRQWMDVKNAAAQIRPFETATPERIQMARDYFRSRQKFTFAPTWISRDWVGINEWIDSQNGAGPAAVVSKETEARMAEMRRKYAQ